MTFTKKEFEAWHREKLQREKKSDEPWRPQPVAECLHCGQPFGASEGDAFSKFPMCNICIGDD